MVEAGAAVLVSDAEIPGRLLDTIRGLLADKGRLREMAARARVLGAPQAADTLAEAVLRLAGANRD
jgi:UDP-N-acetylglucosamine--N-acetylmuramyl-(pentapeptide) pyrophosphoryl-undecaprenol N-acetylglucosamine transferase